VSIDRRALLALATLIALAGVQGALAQAVSIIGLVTDSGGAPLGGVTVEVYRSGSFVGSTTTLANGYFSIPLPGTGTYDIVTYKRGYEKKSLRLDILSSGTVNLGRLSLGYALSIVADATYVVAGQGELVQLPLTIANTGAFLEEINVSVVAPTGWAADLVSEWGFVVKSVMLPPGASRSFVLRVRVPGYALGPAQLELRFAYANVSQLLTVTVEAAAKDWGLVQLLYPEVTSFAGDTLRVPVRVRNTLSESCTINVSVTAPQGWLAFLTVNGTQTTSLRLDPGSTASALLVVGVPDGAQPGKYTVSLRADAFDVSSRSGLAVNVVPGYDRLALDTPTPVVSTYPGAPVSLSVTVFNDGTRSAFASFEVAGLPPGFSWAVKDEQGNVVTAVRVPPRSSQRVVLYIDVPSTSTPTAFNFTLAARGATSRASLELGLIVMGKPSLKLATQNWEVEASAGSSAVFQLAVTNDGQIPLEELQVSVSGALPQGILVRVDPPRVANVPPGGDVSFTLTIVVDNSVPPGRYFIPVVVSGTGVKVERVLALNVRTGGGLFFTLIAALAISTIAIALAARRLRHRGSGA
jgi:uncharacterized membrane protein